MTERIHEVLPRVLPPEWRQISPGIAPIGAVAFRLYSLVILCSVDTTPESTWLHVSVSHAHRLPTWDELREIKETLMGDVLVVQVLPPKSEYVNVHQNCLHLWRRLDGPTMPGFPGESE